MNQDNVRHRNTGNADIFSNRNRVRNLDEHSVVAMESLPTCMIVDETRSIENSPFVQQFVLKQGFETVPNVSISSTLSSASTLGSTLGSTLPIPPPLEQFTPSSIKNEVEYYEVKDDEEEEDEEENNEEECLSPMHHFRPWLESQKPRLLRSEDILAKIPLEDSIARAKMEKIVTLHDKKS
jgi:hypothetical protein